MTTLGEVLLSYDSVPYNPQPASPTLVPVLLDPGLLQSLRKKQLEMLEIETHGEKKVKKKVVEEIEEAPVSRCVLSAVTLDGSARYYWQKLQ